MTHAQLLADRYEILSLLGVGGMGSVYRARDRELDDVVALKVLRRELVNAPEMLARFRLEVKLARRVTHPNVARTFDIGEHQGEKFLTMELVDGESLAGSLARARVMTLARVVELAMPICAGLGAAHAAGVVHRDLKPDNVLLGHDGAVKLTDFGIARALAIAGGPQRTLGIPLGTPAYMAPEQVEGSSHVDARADIYALGAMLYELLTGEAPWRGDSVFAVAAARLLGPPPDPRARRADVPDAAARVVQRCMARAPEDRYASASEVAAALSGLTLPSDSALAIAPSIHVRTPRSSHESTQKTIAVLPVRNLGAPEDQYLVDGLTDDLIDTLSMISSLRVRPRGGVMHLKGVDRDPREIGRDLGVQVVVDGSLRRSGEKLDIRVRLSSVADGFQLWTRRFDRAFADVLLVGNEAATAVASALGVQCDVRTEGPLDPKALDLYLRARHQYHTDWAAGMGTAKLFADALALAPGHPMILAGYALALTRTVLFGDPGIDVMTQARQAAEQAVAAAPNMAEARMALARLHYDEGDALAAAHHLRAAAAVAPGNADAQALWGRLLAECGKLDEAASRSRTALRLDPNPPLPRIDLTRIHALRGEWAEVDALLADLPVDTGAVYVNWLSRARYWMWRRDKEAAKAGLAEIERDPELRKLSALCAVMRHLAYGELPDGGDEALSGFAPVNSCMQRRRSFGRQIRCEVRALFGDIDAAIQELAHADAEQLLDLAWLDMCPLLEQLRGDLRVAPIRQRIAARCAAVVAVLAAS